MPHNILSIHVCHCIIISMIAMNYSLLVMLLQCSFHHVWSNLYFIIQQQLNNLIMAVLARYIHRCVTTIVPAMKRKWNYNILYRLHIMICYSLAVL